MQIFIPLLQYNSIIPTTISSMPANNQSAVLQDNLSETNYKNYNNYKSALGISSLHFGSKKNNITKEELEECIKQGLTAVEISKKYGCCCQTTLNLLKKYKLKTQRQIQKEIISKINKFDLEQLVNQGLNSTQIANKFGCSNVTILYILKRHGLKTKQQINNENCKKITKEILQEYIRQELTTVDMAQKLNCSIRSISLLLKKYGLKTQWQIQMDINNNITKEKLEECIKQNLTIKQTAAKFGCCDETIVKLLKRYNLKTQKQIQVEMIENITKEQIIDAQMNSKNIKECCKKLGGICYSTYYDLLDKFCIEFDEKSNYKEQYNNKYENYSIENLHGRLIELLACKKIENSDELSDLIDFVTMRSTPNDKEKSIVINFIRLLDRISIGANSTNEVLKSECIEELENWQNKLEAIPQYFNTAMNSLYKNQEELLATICFERFSPDIDKDKNIEEAQRVIQIVNNSKNIKEAKYRLSYFTKNTDDSILQDAEKYSISKFGKIEEKIAGQYMVISDLYESYLSGEKILSNIPLEYFNVLSKCESTPDKIIETLIELDDYYTSNQSKEFNLNDFTDIFDKNTPEGYTVINKFVEDFYINNDTKILTKSDSGREVVSYFPAKVKQKIFERHHSKDNFRILKTFESSMKKFTGPSGDNGIKEFNEEDNPNKPVAEVKIKGYPDRIFAINNTYYFDEYDPEGDHSDRKKRNSEKHY